SIRAPVVADAAQLPLRDACIDTVVATFVFCVQGDPSPALRETKRVLRPGGQALFMEFALPARGWQRWFMRTLEPLLHALYGVHWGYDLPALLVAQGLAVNEVRPIWAPMVQAVVTAKRPAR